MELILSVAIAILFGCGVWLILRTRTFQVVIGLSLCAYGVNLFIAATGGLKIGRDPIIKGAATTPEIYADPLPQALVLTAIVIGFATTALLLVVVMVARGLSGGDHVDGAAPGEEDGR